MIRPRILLVDDEDRFRKTLKKRISSRDYEVFDAANGIQALEMIRDDPMDVVVLDVRMPGLSGLETLTEIKNISPETEVIMLTGHASVDPAIEGMKLGAFDYLMKPCDLEDLMVKIQNAFEAKSSKKG
ncbi:sigma-54-dependent transcriptional regulator [Desulfonatronovibrio magnus]|uniref:sigma-54-dependent transcriptional regulator n=1 Tax=Desulfonatronovibrio magnus TaxID=698827 RepID=UPI0005EAD1D6|nr:response regulator [Desulfonatronovibrio magnus]RQD60256.1 MAG: response regulator [Desulfonatronovibrio sp. MSAO_Bac4]